MDFPASGATQTSQDVNEANNPLTPKIILYPQTFYKLAATLEIARGES